jgi:DNA helicase-2/ATP-dependent DNA helicase PcrA
VLTNELLTKNDDVRKKYQERYKYVLVDEYQDTNGPRTRSCGRSPGSTATSAVGDDDHRLRMARRGREEDP